MEEMEFQDKSSVPNATSNWATRKNYPQIIKIFLVKIQN